MSSKQVYNRKHHLDDDTSHRINELGKISSISPALLKSNLFRATILYKTLTKDKRANMTELQFAYGCVYNYLNLKEKHRPYDTFKQGGTP